MKKYSVNVHYDAIIEVNVLADSEEEAIRLAEDEAAKLPHDRMFIPNGPENSCVTSFDDLAISFSDAKSRAFDLVKEADVAGEFFPIDSITIPGKIWDDHEYVPVSSVCNNVSWDNLADTILMHCGYGFEEIDVDKLPEALQYEVFLRVLESAEEL